MAEFFQALTDPEIPFLRFAMIAGVLSSTSFGVIGTYVVVRRISYIAAAISHSVLSGIGLGLFLQGKYDIQWFTPFFGAVIAALISAFIIAVVSIYAKQREDTVIGAIWAVGMALGIIFLSQTPGYVDPMSYLFGDILILSKQDLVLISILDIIVLALGIVFYNKFQTITFDEEFAKARGIDVGLYYVILLFLAALTVVLLVTIVGIIMVIALLTLPPAVGNLFSKHLWQMMLYSALFCIVFTVVGINISYLTDLPTGATIILIAALIYMIALAGKTLWKKRRKAEHLH